MTSNTCERVRLSGGDPRHGTHGRFFRTGTSAHARHPSRRLSMLAALAALVVAFAVPAPAGASGALDQSHTTFNGGYSGIGGPVQVGQTFTAGTSGGLSTIDINIRQDPRCPANTPLTVQIRAVADGLPTTVLATTTVPESSVASNFAYATIDFASPAPVNAGTQYAIVLSAPNAGVCPDPFAPPGFPGRQSGYGWGAGGNGSAYPAGTAVYARGGEANWGTQATDTNFRTYVGDLLPTPSLQTSASADVTIGGQIHDTATIAGGSNPGGTVTFKAYGPDNATCSGAAAFTDTKPITGPGAYVSADFSASAAGTYRWIASYSGDAGNGAVSGACNDAGESVTVGKQAPALATSASADITVGGQIHDTATIAGGFNPTGTITFKAYRNDADCSGSAAFTDIKTVTSGNGNYDSADFTPSAVGTYRWTASYSGDANNNAVSSACNAPGESVVVSKQRPTLETGSADIQISGQLHDTATIAGGFNPTGALTFNLYGPDDASCSGAVVFTSSVGVGAGNGDYDSADFTPTAVGTYRWIASYSGDSNNHAVSGACNDPGENPVVAKRTLALTTTASADVTLGGQISDTATIAAGHNPSGTITFKAYGPNDATCSDTAVFTDTATVGAGNGAYPSASFTPAVTGTFRWIASYSGDSNNHAATGVCNDAGESVEVAKPKPAFATTASADVQIGGQIRDTATISGQNPTGTITFKAYGPDDADCSGAAAFTDTVNVTGNASHDSANFTPATAGTYRWIASYSGDANNAAVSGKCNDSGESVVVSAQTPTLQTQASADVVLGGQVHDTATIAGAAPTGTITFNVYGPDDANCTGTVAFTDTVDVDDGNGNYDSGNFTPIAPGTYRWTADYSGDINNTATTSPCNSAGESVNVAKKTPTFATNASADVTIGGQLSDTATISGGQNPTGTITFSAYGPDDATCGGTAAFTDTVSVDSGNASYGSGDYTPTAVGLYRWIASYSGDANNSAVAGACNDPGESATVSKQKPTLSTDASADITIGGQLSDKATIAAGNNPTGTITFNAYGPNDANCSGVAVFTDTATVGAGNGAYPSASFTPSAVGLYRWIASYSGDANNRAVAAACNDAGESATVAKRRPTITTTASADITIGGQLHDTATIAGGFNPTGTIIFRAYDPDDTNCSQAAAFTDVRNVTAGNGNYDSANITPIAVGTYRWIASYSGDANNHAVAGACNDAGESAVVAKQTPTLHTQASANVSLDNQIHDTATLGGVNPTGAITFKVYGPDDAECSGAAAFSDTRSVNAGSGAYDSANFTPASPGVYRWTADYSGDQNHNPASGPCNAPNEKVTVTKAVPTLQTSASAGVVLGGQIHDSATLGAGHSPTGTITFKLYGEDDATCNRPTAFTDTVNVTSGNGTYDSAIFTPTAAGMYRWTADYSGDVNNASVSSPCNATNESVAVAKLSPTLRTSASADVILGGKIHNTATIDGGSHPSGLITFNLYGPDNANCSGPPVFTEDVGVAGNGSYSTTDFAPTGAGIYRWVADYSGDESNNSASAACNAANESVTVKKHPTTLTTTASPDVQLGGGQIADAAALGGGQDPTGTITFRVYGPDDSNCSGTPAFTATVDVAGNGSYDSGAFTPALPGIYRWIATYSGDAANDAAAGACNEPGESVLVSDAADTTPPETTFRHVPKKPDPKISFYTFASSEPGSTFLCSLNRGKFKPCASPRVLRDLKHGRYRFRVFAIDPAGNRDPTPASDRFRIDDPDKGPQGNPNS